jgi:hypothetical protein
MLQTPEEKQCTIRYFPKDDPTFDSDALTDDQLWQYYVASYAMREPTEGLDLSILRQMYLQRNVPLQPVNLDQAMREAILNCKYVDDQTAFISPDTYKLLLSHDYILDREPMTQANTYVEGKRLASKAFEKTFKDSPGLMESEGTLESGAEVDQWGAHVAGGFEPQPDTSDEEML